MMDLDATKKVLSALERHQVRYVVIGGIAMNLHGLARFTEDLDIFIQPSAENIELLRTALKDVYSDPHISEITAEDLLGEYPAVQYVPPDGPFHIDILTRIGELFSFDDLEAEKVRFEDILVNVATPSTLYKMKRDTVRLRDKSDAYALKRYFEIEDDQCR